MGAQSVDRITQPEAQRLLASTGTAVLATGSIEQHGSHLPLGTDAIAALTIAERVAARLESLLVPLPLVGVAPYHLPWPGSLSLRPDTLRQVILDVCDGLAQAGAQRLLIVNWHEGNTPTLRLAADDVQRRTDARVVIAEGHVITNQLHPDEMELTHAGAMETAAVLAHDPSLVHLDRVEAASEYRDGEQGHELYRQRDVFPILKDFREVAATGWYGHPDRVSLERARQVMDEVADYVVSKAQAAWDEVASREQRAR